MAKVRSRDDIRSAIAVHAARLMAQDGIEDRGLAKRKAAKQLGISDHHSLPANDEIDAALRQYQGIYQAENQAQRIRAMRERAARIMRQLAPFNPHLTGSVLSGTAGPYAYIRLLLFADNQKAVELFLIDHGVVYKAGQNRLYAGNVLRVLPVFTIVDGEAEIELTVFDACDLHAPLRTTPEGRAMERVRLSAVEDLLG